MLVWAGCIVGAPQEQEYRDKLANAGFSAIGVQVTRVYDFTGSQGEQILPDLSEQERQQVNGALSVPSSVARNRR